MNPNQSGIKTWQWVVTVVVIIALIIIGIMVFGNKKTDTSDTLGTDLSTNQSSTDTTNRVSLLDQYPGNVVYLTSVQLVAPGWVVIHEDNSGQPGDIIGSAYFDKGINPGKITLTKSMVDGRTYYAMLHSDDGDKKFNATKDLPLKNTAGSIIMQIFHASISVSNEIKG